MLYILFLFFNLLTFFFLIALFIPFLRLGIVIKFNFDDQLSTFLYFFFLSKFYLVKKKTPHFV